MLKTTRLVVEEVRYGEIDRLVNKELFAGKELFNIAAMEESANDSYKLYHVEPMKPYDTLEIEQWIANNGRGGYVGVTDILNYLCLKGKIDKANYLVDISW